jgi:hypothetical protein
LVVAIAVIVVAALGVTVIALSREGSSYKEADRIAADRDEKTSSAENVPDVEAPPRITDELDPQIVLSTFVTAFRNSDYQPPLSNQELVEAGQAVCTFFDGDAPNARTDESRLRRLAAAILTRGDASSSDTDKITSTLEAWLRATPAGTRGQVAARAALDSVSMLARGAAVSFCPEHLDLVTRPGS